MSRCLLHHRNMSAVTHYNFISRKCDIIPNSPLVIVHRVPKWLKKLHEVKTLGLHFQSLSQRLHTVIVDDSHGEQISSDCEEKTVSLVPHFLLTHADVQHYSIYKLLIPTPNAVGRWGITLKLSPEGPLKRNNWFMLRKLQHTKRFLLRSRHFLFVTSWTERGGGGVSVIAHAIKTWIPDVSFHVGNILLSALPNSLWPL
jgi:hypothetical protein